MKVILVSSGKGGVGKSVTAAGLAVGMAKQGKRVAIMDADIYGPSIPHILGLDHDLEVNAEGLFIPAIVVGLKVISVGLMIKPGKAMVWRAPILVKFLRRMATKTLWGELDYLVVDLPPGTGDVQLTLSKDMDNLTALIVTTPQKLSIIDVKRAVDMFNQVRVPMIGLVENMTYYKKGDLEMPMFCPKDLDIAKSLGVDSVAKVPFDHVISAIADEGKFGSHYHLICQHYDKLVEVVLASPLLKG